MTCFFFFFLAAGDGWKVPFNTRERFSQEFDNHDTDYDGFVGGTFSLGSLVVIFVHQLPLAFFRFRNPSLLSRVWGRQDCVGKHLVASLLFSSTFVRVADRCVFRTLADVDRDGKLDRNEFILAMYFLEETLASKPLPGYLPMEFLPPNKKKAR